MCERASVCGGAVWGPLWCRILKIVLFLFVFVPPRVAVVAVLTLSGKGLRFRVRAYVFHVRGLFSFLLIFQALITHRVAL